MRRCCQVELESELAVSSWEREIKESPEEVVDGEKLLKKQMPMGVCIVVEAAGRLELGSRDLFKRNLIE